MTAFNRAFFDYLNALKRDMQVKPLVLGGATSSGPGIGGPAGGFIGYLPQGRVTYDAIELGTLDTTVSGPSLWDNLNHIRYRLDVLESGPPISIITVSGEYYADIYDDVIIGNATTSGFTVILPTTSGNAGKEYKVKKVDSSSNVITISGIDSETFDGESVHTLSGQYQYQTYINDGEVWHLF